MLHTAINYLDLFSGIGGFRLGLEHAGFQFKWTGHSEINAYAKSIYHRHFIESEDLGNVNEINLRKLPEIDLVTFGFPCQDLSLAGKRRGLHAPRSGLFFRAMQIVKHARPKIFILENVQGLLHSNKGRDFETVLRTIADTGLYECEGQLLNTRWVLPQNRERFYLVGHLKGASRPKVFPIGKGIRENDVNKRYGINIVGLKRGVRAPGQKIFDAFGNATTCVCSTQDFLVDPYHYISHRSGRLRRTRFNPARKINLRRLKQRIRRLMPVELERLQGFPDGWTESGINERGEIIEISDNQRFKALGNAVSVPVVQLIGFGLLEG